PHVHWQTILQQNFGDSTSLTQAWRVNPTAILWHVVQNARGLARCVGWMASPRFLAQDNPLAVAAKEPFLWPCLVLGVLGGLGLVSRLARSGKDLENERGLLLVLLMLTLVALPAAASVLIIFPHVHYILPAVVFCLGVAAANLGHLPVFRRFSGKLESIPALLAVGALILVVIPNLAHGWDVHTAYARLTGQPREPDPVLSQRATIDMLKNLKGRGPVVVLDAMGHTHTLYAGLPAESVYPHEKSGNFWSFIRQKNVNLIVIDGLLLTHNNFRRDPEFCALVTQVRTQDFKLLAVPGTLVHIAVRKDLLGA